VASNVNVDGNTNTRTYDAAGHLTEIKLAAGGTTKADMDYTHNRAGLARTEAVASINAAVNGTASFAYDHLGRLTNYDSPIASTADRDYAWAKVPNRTGVTSDPSGTPSTLTYTYDDADRITADSASGTHSTDAQGRVAARPSRQFIWDSLGRLTTVKDGSGVTITTYTYDALDRVRSYTNSGTQIIFRYVGTSSAIALVRDNTAGVTDRYLLNDLANQPWGYLNASGGSRVSWLRNAHHDVVATFSSAGALQRYYRYTPDGAFAASGGSGITPHAGSSPLGMTGPRASTGSSHAGMTHPSGVSSPRTRSSASPATPTPGIAMPMAKGTPSTAGTLRAGRWTRRGRDSCVDTLAPGVSS
jgi:YD repeat-containing protein